MKTKNFVKLIENIKEKNALDLSAGEDLSISLMNLVSLEEHAFFSYVKTKDDKFLKILEIVRELRKKLLVLIVKVDDESETWCMSKHFLASSMRLYEVGNRFLHEGKEKEAKSFYEDSAELYGLFWMLNLSGQNKMKKNAKENPAMGFESNINKKEEKGIFNTIKKLLDCCKE